MEALSAALYIAAYLSAVVDGTLQDKGLYPIGARGLCFTCAGIRGSA
jgi:hypothetical protein